jgi:hypothetical protein
VDFQENLGVTVRILNFGTKESERLASRSSRFISAKSGYDINQRRKEKYFSSYWE